MSFLSGTTVNLPTPPPALMGQNPANVSSDQLSRVVPYLAGTDRVGIIFQGDIFNYHAEPVFVDAKKESVVSGYNVFASFGFLVCHGPADRVSRIWFNDNLVWPMSQAAWDAYVVAHGVAPALTPINRGGSDYVDITIPGRGLLRLYWGTETQTYDPAWVASGQNPPTFRGQVYGVFKDLLLGYQVQQVPNVELELSRWQKTAWLTTNANSQGDINPVALVSEVFQNKRLGMGLPDARLNTTDLIAAADQLQTECVGLSVFLSRSESVRQFLVTLCQYFDGYFRFDQNGRFTMGLIREITANVSLPEFTEADMTAEPEPSPASWESTANRVLVKFKNRNFFYKDDSAPATDRGNYEVTGQVVPQQIDALWIKRPVYAQALAVALQNSMGTPDSPGRLKIRKSSAITLFAGGAFRWSYGHYGQCHLLCRCSKKTTPDPAKGEVEIEYLTDKAFFNTTHVTPPGFVEPPSTLFAASPLVYQTVVEIPYGLKAPLHSNTVLFLAARPSTITNALVAYHQKAGGSYETVLKTSTPYALRGHLLADYGATNVIDDKIGMSILLDGVDLVLPQTPLADAQTNEWLLFLGDEIMSAFGATLVAAGQYKLFAIRSRFDTAQGPHLNGDSFFLIPKAGLPAWLLNSNLGAQVFKLQPVAAGGALDISLCPEIPVTITSRAMRPPSLLNLRAFTQRQAATFTTGQDIPLAWDIATEERPNSLAKYDTTLPSTEIDFMNHADVVVATRKFAAGIVTFTYTNALLVADLGSEQTFKLRGYHARNGYRSRLFSAITVTKI